jgi:1-aminocyclopropane-1-carboxylate deaminase
MLQLQPGNISTEHLVLPALNEKNISASVLRLDKIHPVISGNKWFKLRYYLEEVKQQNKKKIITFGGAWSNHIVATAAACRLYGLSSTGIIRGEQAADLSPTLKLARELGMELVFISREDYRQKKISGGLINNESYVINEGGYGIKGAEGASTILEYCENQNYSHICCACGTGTMAAGLINGSGQKNKIIAVSVLKNNSSAETNIKALLQDKKK